MTNQDKKKWLQRYTELNKAINQISEECERQRALCERITPVYTDMPGRGPHDRTDAYIKLVELQDKANAKIDEYTAMREEIEEAINTISNMSLRTLMRYRYLNGETWEKIAVKMNYSWRNMHYLHGQALRIIQIEEVK